MSPENAIAWSIMLPLLGAVGVMLTGRLTTPNIRDGLTLLTASATMLVVLSMVDDVMAGARPMFHAFEVMPGISLAFEVEPLGMLYGMVAGILWLPTSFYAIGYMRGHNEENQTRFFTCFALAIFAALGIAFSANLFTLFLFYELLTFSTYPLVTHYGNDEARRAGRIYMGILIFTSVALLLFAVLITYHVAGTLDFKPGGILAGKISGFGVPLLLALFAFGTGKAALMPFHKWLPTAMVAPTPVSALLHAVAIVKAGVFTVLKVAVYIFGVDFLHDTGASQWLMYMAAFTLLSSSVIALTKDNLKARLAYSTISQLAYIVLGAALATAAGVMGGGLHIAMHAVGKITLFFCAGAVYVALHKKKISTMNGIGKQMPFTMGAFFLGSLCIIGLPPTGGSWSKLYLILGALEAEQMIFVVVLCISSLLSIAYLMPVVYRAFFLPLDPTEHHHDSHPSGDAETDGDHAIQTPATGGFWANVHEAPLFCVVPLCLTAVGSLAIFFYTQELYDLLLPITQVMAK